MSVDRRQMILDGATKAFTQFGYKATTMDLVAKLANVGKGTIYTFFKNKEELFDEIFTSLLMEMRKIADEAIDEKNSFSENLHLALFAILEFRKNHQLTIKIFQENAELGTSAVKEMIEKMEQMIIRYIKTKVKEAIEKGDIKPCDPELTAFVMVKLYIALIFDWEKRYEPLTKEEVAESLELYVLKGLSATT
ncbi:TetR/AcrR family transcriptional regulator [Bacillus altitudinis]|jgi:TetR/AcrR family transcriptional regulator of autoinduction and epiphytic fitness|uniref:TetR/AcrR family transcriptional regulator n=2 Tax=Bacillus altitudinis TaxID=293387 RepID=A0A1K2BHG9_BACAB|nr:MULTISPECIES: TetR/AcrR family transcriptional regulator [Bacillus]AMM88372.1 TetR family transcriptional regulator [Bacillus pumilus]EMI14700.1 family transcriptional regulator [Bacillus stratosphericus LAMA 585]KOA74319.1 TetR family transcriptional regulator [Bacillus stratosphericus]KQL47979.1 TetR family transcriptional regulator [Bacillus sp. FJAT-21955]MDH8709745.1 TetR/AcrR family transcriptional regulator of autoinduction and epiphytic fitness [Micromonospora sp. 1209]CVM57229.1 T